MQKLEGDPVNLTLLFLYGLIILLYLFILRLLLNVLQQLNDKHHVQRSVVDVDIRRVMTPQVESSMHAFDISMIAITIAKGAIATVATAVVIILLVLKVGILATALLVAIVVLIAWAVDIWLRSRKKPAGVRAQMYKIVQRSGSFGMILMLSILLVALLFVMIWIH